MTAAFQTPAWSEPIDLPALLRAAPREPTVKGMLLQHVVEEARAASNQLLGRGAYAALDDYPLREWIELLARGAELTHPGVPVREGLRRLGQGCYAMVAESLIGKVLMSMTGDDLTAALRLAPRIYRVAATCGSAEVSFLEPRRAIVQLRDFWDFPDAYHVGIFEGGLRVTGKQGEVRTRTLGLAAVDLEITWA